MKTLNASNVAGEHQSAGDALPSSRQVIEIRVAELRQLFNAIDPSPFRDKDIDPRAEEFIVGWAKELSGNDTLGLRVHLDRPAGLPDEAVMLGDAIRQFFRHRVAATKRRLRELLRVGRTSLLIGLGFLAASILLGEVVETALAGRRIGGILRESFLIGGWVAMWRPLEIFLYDWWPIRAEARLYARLSEMPVRIVYTGHAGSDAWRRDWPAAAPDQTSGT